MIVDVQSPHDQQMLNQPTTLREYLDSDYLRSIYPGGISIRNRHSWDLSILLQRLGSDDFTGMAAHMAVIAASRSAQTQAGSSSNPQSFPNQLPHVRRVSYGATSSQSSPRAPNIIEEEDVDDTLRFDNSGYHLSEVDDDIHLGGEFQQTSVDDGQLLIQCNEQ